MWLLMQGFLMLSTLFPRKQIQGNKKIETKLDNFRNSIYFLDFGQGHYKHYNILLLHKMFSLSTVDCKSFTRALRAQNSLTNDHPNFTALVIKAAGHHGCHSVIDHRHDISFIVLETEHFYLNHKTAGYFTLLETKQDNSSTLTFNCNVCSDKSC